jgi:SlyX protein
MMTDIQEQVMSLEIKLAFQDDLVETLNQIVIEQQQQLNLLQKQVQLLYQQLKSLQPSNLADLAEEVPPPHY